MRVIVNETLINRRAKWGGYAGFGGMALMVGSLFMSMQGDDMMIWSYLPLIIGFAMANIGFQYRNRWGRSPRDDEILSQGIKGMGDNYSLYGYYLPAELVLLSPFGLFPVVVRQQAGTISYQKGKWKQRKGGISRVLSFFAGDPLGDPVEDALDGEEGLQEFLEEEAPDVDVPLRGVVVFANPKVSLDLGDAEFPVTILTGRDLKNWARKPPKVKAMPNVTRRELESILDGKAR